MTAPRTVRKAVIPVAGLGTRFLPATKAQPKEMLMLVDKPLIQYAVEEAVASGLENIILVTSPGKEALEDHFNDNPELARALEDRGKEEEAMLVRQVADLARVTSVRQRNPLGLGHAIGCARELVGEEPFAVLLPDEVIDAEVPCTRQLLEVQAHFGGCVVATQEVRGPEIEAYGVMRVEPVDDPSWRARVLRARDLVEKPKAAAAPSPFVVVGRYVLDPEIFALLAATQPARGGEIQLTDALARFAREKAVHAARFQGVRLDAGNKPGFLRATVHLALKHPELGPALREYLKSLKL